MTRETMIRLATADDLNELVALWAHYLRAHHRNSPYRHMATDGLARRRETFSGLIESPDAAIFVLARADGGLDGMIACMLERNAPYFLPPRYARIQTPYVRPDARRRGNLKRLLKAATRWARERGMTEMRLFLASENVIANALAEELGFDAIEVVRRRPVGRRRAPWSAESEW